MPSFDHFCLLGVLVSLACSLLVWWSTRDLVEDLRFDMSGLERKQQQTAARLDVVGAQIDLRTVRMTPEDIQDLADKVALTAKTMAELDRTPRSEMERADRAEGLLP